MEKKKKNLHDILITAKNRNPTDEDVAGYWRTVSTFSFNVEKAWNVCDRTQKQDGWKTGIFIIAGLRE